MTEFWLSSGKNYPLILLDMKTSHFIIACTFGIFTYFFLLGWYGPAGWLALEQKRAYLQDLELHLENLEHIQGNLANRVIAMEQDEEKIIQEIQRLGYLNASQVIVRTGVSSPSLFGASPGAYITRSTYESPPLGYFLAGAFGVFLGIASLGMITTGKHDYPRSQARTKEFPA